MSTKRRSTEELMSVTPEKKTMPVNGITRFLREFVETLHSCTAEAMLLPLWQLCGDYLSQMDVFYIAVLSGLYSDVDIYQFLRDHSALKDDSGVTETWFTLPRRFMGYATQLLVHCPRMSLPVFRLCKSTLDVDGPHDCAAAEFDGPTMSIALFHAIVDGNRDVTRAILKYDASVPHLCLDFYLPKLLRGQGYTCAVSNYPAFVEEFYEQNIREVKLEPKSLPALFDVAVTHEGIGNVAVQFIHDIARAQPRESLRVWLTHSFEEFNEFWPVSMFRALDMEMARDDAVYVIHNRVSVDGWSEILDAHDDNLPLLDVVVRRLYHVRCDELGFVYHWMLHSKAETSPNIASIYQSL